MSTTQSRWCGSLSGLVFVATAVCGVAATVAAPPPPPAYPEPWNYATDPGGWLPPALWQWSNGNIFDGIYLRDPPEPPSIRISQTGQKQRSLFWNFENPDPQFPDFWGVYDPNFADYRLDTGGIHDGCDVYNLAPIQPIPNPPDDPQFHGLQAMVIPPGGEVSWHLNNIGTNELATWKHVWWQFDYWNGDPFLPAVPPPVQASGTTVQDMRFAHLAATQNSWGTILIYVEFYPNPPWEDLKIINGTGRPFWVDNVRIVTEHVPEPAAIVMLTLVGLALFRRRGIRPEN